MTVSSEVSRDQQVGNGVTLAFTVPFRILDQDHVRVLFTIAGVTTTQVITTNYTVSGVGSPTHTVTFLVAPSAITTITFLRNVPFTQETDYVPNDPFPAESHEDALDKLTMLVQQLNEVGGEDGRTIKIPAETSGVSTTLPAPVAATLWGWDAGALAPRYYTPADIGTAIAFSNFRYDVFTALAAQTVFVLSADPGALGNLDVSIDGVVQVPGTDYTYLATALTFAVAMAGGEKVLVRYGTAAPVLDAVNVTYTPQGAGATQRTTQDRLRDFLTAKDYGVVGDGVTDDTSKFEAWIDALQLQKRVGYVPPGNYSITTIRRRALTQNLKIVCDPGAVFIGASTKQDFAGAGQTSFTVTTFLAGFNGFIVVHVSSLGVQTVLTEATEYTVAGQVIDTSTGSAPFGAVAVGDTLRVVSANAMIELGANSLGLCAIDWQGGKIDASARGYAENTGSGSGIVFYNTRRGSCKDAYFYASDDWQTAIATGLGGDSGVTTIACDNFEVAGCLFRGWGDLGVYATGNADAAETDDGYGVDIHSCGFIRCQSAASIKRGGQGGHIHHCWARECRIGFSFYPTGNNPNGARGSIHDNFGLRIGRIFTDCRSTTGVSVHDNTVIDLGYDPDGVTPTTTPVAFNFSGVTGGVMHNNVAVLSAWNNAAGQRGIGFGADTSTTTETTNSSAHHNKIIGFAEGVDESGAGTGNVFRDNELTSCTTPMDVLAARRWHYRTSNIDHEGIGTVEYEGSWTPVAAFSNGGGSFVHTTQFGRYVRRGNVVTVIGRIQFTATHAETTAQLRISGLPYTSRNTASQESPGTLGYLDAQITPPANTIAIVPKIPINVNYFRLDCLVNGSTPVVVQGSHVTSAVSCRLDFQLTYECAAEALN